MSAEPVNPNSQLLIPIKALSACLKDGPPNLRTQGAHIRSVLGTREIIFTQGPFDGQRMTSHVCSQGTVGKIDIVMRALVNEGRNCNGGDHKRSPPAYGTYVAVAGNESRRLPACM